MDRQEQLRFAAEVVVDAADAGAGCADDLADGGGAVAALPENGNRGVENALLRRVGFGPAPPAVRRNHRCAAVTHRIVGVERRRHELTLAQHCGVAAVCRTELWKQTPRNSGSDSVDVTR